MLDLDDLEARARAAVAAGVYELFASGAEDELTVAANVRAWRELPLWPRVLRTGDHDAAGLTGRRAEITPDLLTGATD